MKKDIRNIHQKKRRVERTILLKKKKKVREMNGCLW